MSSKSERILRVQLLHPDARLPRRETSDAAGYDLASVQFVEIPPHGTAVVSTGLAIAVPDGTYGRIAPRSGLAAKHSIGVGAGVVDCGYRGDVKVVLFNHGRFPWTVNPGDRIAQLILECIFVSEVIQCDALDETERGHAGFGSTGGFQCDENM